jgi:hypothetical protein
MTTRHVSAALLAVFVWLTPGVTFAQTNDDYGVVQRLTLSDGSQVYGRVEASDEHQITFRSLADVVMTIPRSRIIDLRVAEGRVVAGSFEPADPHSNRLMFAPTARTLRKGEGYVGVYYVFPFVQVGVTDRVSIGGGTPLLFGDGAHPVWFTPKVQVVSGRRVQAAAGLIHLTGIEGINAGIAYGVTTIGSDSDAMSIGLGYGYSGRRSGRPILMVGGEHRASRRIKLITENWYWGGEAPGFVSGGVRFLGERLSADVSLVVPLVGEAVAFPIVSFAWHF